MKKLVIFGAGKFGRMAQAQYKEQIEYFIDNNLDIQGKKINGVLVRSIEDYIIEGKKYPILIACKSQEMIERQLIELNIKNYSFFLKSKYAYFNTEQLIYNPYEIEEARDLDEDSWNKINTHSFKIEQINMEVESIYKKNDLFQHIEIETVNRCNGLCDFCPVSKNNDTRNYFEMTDELFESIIDQLSDINYSGKIALFSNNEPLLDDKIIERHYYARKKLPNARMHLFTNGTLLTIEKFKGLIESLDELIIDNYHQELNLIKPCKEIEEYCEKHPELKNKVTIVLRKPQEILTSRGGTAPNRKKMISYSHVKCVLPFKQIIVRPDGKVSLCCNDPLGKNTLGDLTKESILEVWNSEKFQKVRNCLYRGRGEWSYCKFCDTLSLG